MQTLRIAVFALITFFLWQNMHTASTASASTERQTTNYSVPASTNPNGVERRQTPPTETASTPRQSNKYCASRIVSHSEEYGTLRVEFEGSAKKLYATDAFANVLMLVRDVCESGRCAIRLEPGGPFTLRFDDCPSVWMQGGRPTHEQYQSNP